MPVKAGPRVVGVAFIKKNAAESVEPLQPFTRDLDMQNMNGLPLIEHVQIAGPFNADRRRATRRAGADFRLPAGRRPRGDEAAVREADPVDAGAPRLSPSGDRRRHRDAARASTRPAARTAASTPASRTRCG